MSIVVRRTFECELVPDNLSGFTVNTQYAELLFVIGSDAIRMQKLFSFVVMDDGFMSRHQLAFYGRRHKDSIAPNDWRRMSTPGNSRFPFYVLGGCPFRWQVLLFGDSRTIRSSPLRPVPGCCLFGEDAQSRDR